MLNHIAQNYHKALSDIQSVCATHARPALEVTLLAVSKTHPVAAVIEAYAAGARHFGENYVQEGIEKVGALEALIPDHTAIWHFIGPLQSNKTRLVAQYFDWVHSIDRIKIAQRLSEQRPHSLRPINLCIQVNISAQSTKSGCTPEEAIQLAQQMIELPNITLRGLMAIPAPMPSTTLTHSESPASAPFRAMAQLFTDIQSQLPETAAKQFDTLSMGMSDDYPLAIAAGSTLVRIGTAIFGARAYPN